FNNAAMHQMLDDIKRTVIINLDVAHRTIQLRLGKEISPETMNLFMETLQHRLSGGAVIQEHMSEIHPGLTQDGYGKVFTGDDELADQFDRRFIVNINNEFCPERAEMLKVGVGDKLCLAVHEPTLRVRMMDGGAIVRSAAQSATMSFVATYRLTGESVLSDIAFSTRHAQQVRMGEILWQNRSRAPNEPGGIPFGYLADMCPAESNVAPIPTMELLASGDMDAMGTLFSSVTQGQPMWTELLTNAWYGQYMAGGVGFNCAAISFLGSGFLDINELTASFGDVIPGGGEDGATGVFGLMGSILGGHERMPARWRAIKPFVHMVSHLIMDEYDKYPTLMEFHWGGAIRTFVVGYGGSIVAALFTGDSQLTQIAANYAVGLGMKEGWFRTGWSGQEVQHHTGLAYGASLRPEEGGLPELKGPNVPYMSYTVGSLGFPMFCYAAMLARGSAWAASPLIKVAFSDPDLSFDFRHATQEFAKAVLKEFEPAGERDIIRPAR
ncbi:MAG: methyl-coenzyme M reductase subunit alpha, partial [Halobacteriota archaeon]|nr:methyl-coenzyme M reductase subunit alpha [Halobacteriota archaeon]